MEKPGFTEVKRDVSPVGWGCRIPFFPGSLWSGEVAPDKVLSMDKIELFDI